MKKRNFLEVMFVGVIIGVASAATAQASESAKEALRTLESKPFQRDAIRAAVENLRRAMRKNPDDPWVYLGLARAHLVSGYRSNSWFEARNFSDASVRYAWKLVNHAVELNPRLSRALTMRARLQIIRGDYRQAWDTLNRAHALDEKSFYAWYLVAVLNRYYQEYDAALKLLRRAEALITEEYQNRWLLDLRVEVAEALDDPALEERAHKKTIALFPERAHGYGNYGAFLLEQERYGEAITQLEKALSIERYPLAKKQLREARRAAAQSD